MDRLARSVVDLNQVVAELVSKGPNEWPWEKAWTELFNRVNDPPATFAASAKERHARAQLTSEWGTRRS